jgi:exonuclease SbcC
MRIQLKKLTLQNFKGIRSLSISFFDTTNVFGQNATGKTTIFDAFLWLLFGKDSTDRKDFEIKTLDENNEPYHRLDHEVAAVIDVDGEETMIKRTLREKWTKKRGSSETEFTGHETAFFWNDVPCKEKEYQDKIAGILNENVFKLITNTGYFNSLKWQDRRSVLLQLAGTISDQDIASTNPELFTPLLALIGKKTLEEYKRQVSAKKRTIKDELDLLPARIDEANRSLPDVVNYDEVEGLLSASEKALATVDSELMDKTNSQRERQQQVTSAMQQIQHLRQDAMNIEFKAKNEVKDKRQKRDQVILDKRRELQNLNNEVARFSSDITLAENKKERLAKEQQTLRDQWSKVDAETLQFDEKEFCCPTCKRAYEARDIDAKKAEMTENFNESKSKRLGDISTKGKSIGNEISLLQTEIDNLVSKREAKQSEVSGLVEAIRILEDENVRLSENEAGELQKFLSENVLYKDTLKKIGDLDKEINTHATGDDNSALLLRKKTLTEEIHSYRKQLSSKDQREKTLQRIKDLENQEKELAAQLANEEGTEFAILQFEKAKMDVLESRINGRFKIVRFKLFETQINGGEVACCETLINGVPYQDANTASRVQGGIDIINVLSDHYGVVAPIFIDNRESVIKIPDTEAQIVNLVVSSADKKLRIESEFREAVAV